MSNDMIKQMIQKVVEKNDLSEEEMVGAMTQIMEGRASDAQIGAFITGLRMKGETISEIAGAARVMRDKATRIHVQGNVGKPLVVVDTCGTGGDGAGTFNVSTTTALVAAGGGLVVAKHGNRSVSSSCGSADVLEALGVNVDVSPSVVEDCIKRIGIGFLFAPKLHGAMKYAIGPRREIGIRTIFNLLGPLTNPAGATVQLLGVYSPSLTSVLAEVLLRLGSTSAMVVCGQADCGYIDEISITGPTQVSELRESNIRTYTMIPEDAGVTRASMSDIQGADAARNAAIVREILNGQLGPKRDLVLLNAGAAFYTARKVASIREGVILAGDMIASGGPALKLEQLIEMTNLEMMNRS